MLDIAWSELLLVVVVAILVVGPKELPGLLRSLGRMLGKLRSTADDFRKQFDEALKEAGGDDLQREMRSLRTNNPISEVKNSIEDMGRGATKPDTPAKPANTDSAKAEGDILDDDLGPPPPLPPRDAPSASKDEALAGPKPGPAESGETADSSTSAQTSDNTAAPDEQRLNGQHQPASRP